MSDYERETRPVSSSRGPHIYLLKATHRTEGLPVTVKQHDFFFTELKPTQQSMTRTLNTALVQAKLRHTRVCDVLSVQLEVNRSSGSICLVLETVDTDLEKDIEERRRTKSPYTERELSAMALQTAEALTYTHSTGVAHTSLRPASILRAGHTYKLSDFGSCFKRDVATGSSHYMSPQLRAACMRGTAHHPEKTDVFALGAVLLHMSSGLSPGDILTAPAFHGRVKAAARSLPPSLQSLTCRMLSEQEEDRPTLQEVCAIITSQTSNLSKPLSKCNPSTPDAAEKDLLAAITVLSQRSPLDISFANSVFSLAMLYYDCKRFPEAEAQLKRAISLYSANFPRTFNYASCLHRLGRVYRELHRNSEAAVEMKKAATLLSSYFPQHSSLGSMWGNLGGLYAEMNKYVEGEAAFLKAVAVFSKYHPLSSDYVSCLKNFGKLYEAMQRYSDAEKVYLQAVTLASVLFPATLILAESLGCLGRACLAQKQYAEAEPVYLRALTLFSHHFPQNAKFVEILYELGILYEKTRRVNDAENTFQRCCATNFPTNYHFVRSNFKLAKIYQKTQRFPLAEEYYSRSAQLFSRHFPQQVDSAVCLWNLARVYESMGKTEQAREQYQAAFKAYQTKGRLKNMSDCRRALKTLRVSDSADTA